MRMVISEGSSDGKIDVRDYPEYVSGEIIIEFPDPHIEMTLDLGEATKLNCLLNSAIQNICHVREESQKHGDGN